MKKILLALFVTSFSTLVLANSVRVPYYDRTATDETAEARTIKLKVESVTNKYSNRKNLENMIRESIQDFKGCSYNHGDKKVVENLKKVEILSSDCDTEIGQGGNSIEGFALARVNHRCTVEAEFVCEKTEESKQFRNEDLDLSKECLELSSMIQCNGGFR